jgi:L-fuconolactonase
MKIDTHHHFWKYSAEEYGWISDAMSVIRRDFLPADLQRETAAVGIDGVVSVQARQTLEETQVLLDWAREHDFIRGVVGWVPLVSPSVRSDLERFAGRKELKGVRHVLHDEADERYMLREDFNEGVRLLKELGLVYDILIFERHLPQTLQFVDRHADQVFVLDHIAKPRIRDGYLSPWQTNIVQLAHRPNIYCKVSGMVTEADHRNWTEKELAPYFDTVFSAFGPERLMFGSDWPVCLVAASYQRWFEVVNGYVSQLSDTEQERFWSGTALEAYRL